MAKSFTKVTSRGQITIPKTVRDKYGLTQGSTVEVIDLGGSIIIVPKETIESVNRMHTNFDFMREELIAADVTLDDMMNELKKLRDANE